MSKPSVVSTDTISESVLVTARKMSKQLGLAFRAHDCGDRAKAIDAFTYVDANQFQDLDERAARHAATAFVDALWAKDDIELEYLRNGELDGEGLEAADYTSATRKLRERAAIIGADPRYAVERAEAWRRHKAGGDYWTPFGRAIQYEFRAAIDDPTYPRKPRAGQDGLGPEPLRYVLAFELHDMHDSRRWKEGELLMIPYFARILEEHHDGTS